MAKINTKLYGDQYQTLDDFLSDFQLMFDNACRYNEPDSQVYKVVFVVCILFSAVFKRLLKNQYQSNCSDQQGQTA